MQEAGIAALGQKLSARDLLRRPEVRYQQITQLVHLIGNERNTEENATDRISPLPELPIETAEEVELQVKYEHYVRKQEQMVQRTLRLEEMRIPETIDYAQIQHLRTEARQKLARTRPRTVGQASRVEGVTPADIAILMIYLEKLRAIKMST